jgi:uncharacterized protein with GYD domain
MATYISLISWTQQGIENVKDSPKRLDAAKKAFKAAGAELKQFYMTMGQYDMVCVIEAPDDATVAKLSLSLGVKGSVRTETLKAFDEAEYRKIVSAVS